MISQLLKPATLQMRAILAIVLVAVALALLITLAGANPLDAIAALFSGAFGEPYVLAETLVTATPLAIVALGVMPALRSGLFTIGSQGQLVAGAALSTAVIQANAGASAPVLLILGCLSGMAGGLLFALLPALLRAYMHVNEILSTLLLNYIAGYGLVWVLKGPLRSSMQTATPRSDALPDTALIGTLVDGTRLHLGVFAVLVLAVALWFWTRTRSGLVYSLFASRPHLAARLGLSPARAVVRPMLFSGAAAGLAGWIQVAGVAHTLYPSVDGGLGFSGILVAVLGGLNPLGIVIAAILFGALSTGAQGMQIGTSVPAAIAIVAQGFVLLAVTLAVGKNVGTASAAPPMEKRPASEAAGANP
ncbi:MULTISPECIES: ABC transporter permease [unclassified Rhizobium]|uniref:ABC transporter permease n=1 Tax=unclassified Rhizobium TaxID=2613769 RepID=UPI001ADD0499|nr:MULTISPECIES: ABC transporter permease [unclassified Rhizobium]MBO9096682.1 ABC transporter permease [Rhizobium sp. L58/93]MBO9134445.1 ABC transporter permease [Rhizobium sp. B209b/85]MBO9166937.1 ABC transporter permease [Rhizobium sp. L245/93]MBO9182909.1 ABC transporter permease [Rhizobium sp. E27B/91]QXZ83284.1 ABC transporter permease [Rhizobium sp. K1/93]